VPADSASYCSTNLEAKEAGVLDSSYKRLTDKLTYLPPSALASLTAQVKIRSQTAYGARNKSYLIPNLVNVRSVKLLIGGKL
jgi:hypothetical protein